MSAPELRTGRLVLREIAEADAPRIVRWRSDPQVYRYFVSPHAVTMEEHLRWYRERYLPDSDRLDWMARGAEGAPVGVFGVRREEADAVEAEVSYLLAPEEYGKGYATEAVTALLAFLRGEWRCRLATAQIHVENQPSLRLAERLGFVRVSSDGALARWERPL